LLIAGALVALAWANLSPSGYERAIHPLHFVVNDIAMTFFFALAAIEVRDAMSPEGALHVPRHAALPLVAAVGGMAAPAAIYLALVRGFDLPGLARGWAIPCATDIAFSYLAARAIFGARHPAIPFLLLLAIADDALGLLIIAIFYPSGPVRPLVLIVLLSIAIAAAALLPRWRIRSSWAYLLIPGIISWAAFYSGGLHPALAFVPVIPFFPLETIRRFERRWKDPVQVILFFFSLVNAGVAFSSTGPGTWIVLAAILAGKPIGILAAVALGLACGLHKPRGMTWPDLTVLGTIAGTGFTVALFFTTASFPSGPLLDQTKMGALLSFSAAGIAAGLSMVLRRQRAG
jgi:NhaA family Na+:H+ antiporter